MSENKLTSEKVEDKYSDVKLKFHSYYKYSFTFKGEADDGAIITVSYGGNHHDIYRYTVTADSELELGRPQGWNYCEVKKDGETLYEHHNY